MAHPTNAEFLGNAVSIALIGRSVIAATNRGSPKDTSDTLDAIAEALASLGGSLLFLADAMGCRAEVEQMVAEAERRMASANACRGLGGRA